MGDTVNLVVTDVVSGPVFKLLWIVVVMAHIKDTSITHKSEKKITTTFLSKESADLVCVGYEFTRMKSEF